MWIESESGNLINSRAIQEFAIIGPYSLDEEDGPHDLYDLYAFNVGEVEHAYHGKQFADAHRYLLQHQHYAPCEWVLDQLKRSIRMGNRYFGTRAVLKRYWNIKEYNDKHASRAKRNGVKVQS